MDDTANGRLRRQRPIFVPNARGLTIGWGPGGVLPVPIMVGIQAILLLLLLVGCSTPDRLSSRQQARDRQAIVAAHPEWPTAIRGAVASGVICAGMTADMVRAAWGRPTRISSSGSELHPRDTWHYTGRQRSADVIGGQTDAAQPLREWTVAFANGWVVEWTD
jgi:hypothetical protein